MSPAAHAEYSDRLLGEAPSYASALPGLPPAGIIPRSLMRAKPDPERWPSGRRRAPAKGVWVKSPSRVRIPPSPPIGLRTHRFGSVPGFIANYVGVGGTTPERKRRRSRAVAKGRAAIGPRAIPPSPPRYRFAYAPVAQLDRAPGYEPGGRGFESLRARQFIQTLTCHLIAALANNQVVCASDSIG